MKKVAIYPGTFDPVTLGHLDVIIASSKIFDKVVIAISSNIKKNPMFKEIVRTDMILEELSKLKLKNCEVVVHHGLTGNLAKSMKATSIIRGLRLTSEYEKELDISFNNYVLSEGINTVFIAPLQEHIHIRSSTVRELVHFGVKELSGYIPESVLKRI